MFWGGGYIYIYKKCVRQFYFTFDIIIYRANRRYYCVCQTIPNTRINGY